MISREELERLYLSDGLSSKQIADRIGCHADTVLAWLKRYGIAVRSSSTALKLRCSGWESPNKGNRWTPEHHELHKGLWNNSEFRAKVIAKRSGANSPLWRGGISRADNLHLARVDWLKRAKECYVRDSGLCRDCGVKCLSRSEASTRRLPKRLIQAHHIIARRDGGGDELENLVTLCVSCHHKRERRSAGALFA